jgi:hypothetical protein
LEGLENIDEENPGDSVYVYEKKMDCAAYFSEDGVQCAIGEHVPCPNDPVMCQTDQCCPDGTTCPSAPSEVASGCPKGRTFSCELFGWDVSLRVRGVDFSAVTPEAKAEFMARAQNTYAWNTRMSMANVKTSVREGSIILDATLPGNPGWSQKKTDMAVESGIKGPGTRLEIIDMVADIPGIILASSSNLLVEEANAGRVDQPTKTPTKDLTPAPPSPARTPVPTQGPTVVWDNDVSAAFEGSVLLPLALAVLVVV